MVKQSNVAVVDRFNDILGQKKVVAGRSWQVVVIQRWLLAQVWLYLPFRVVFYFTVLPFCLSSISVIFWRISRTWKNDVTLNFIMMHIEDRCLTPSDVKLKWRISKRRISRTPCTTFILDNAALNDPTRAYRFKSVVCRIRGKSTTILKQPVSNNQCTFSLSLHLSLEDWNSLRINQRFMKI